MRAALSDSERRILEERLGHRFRSRSLLDQAFTHASFANLTSPANLPPPPAPSAAPPAGGDEKADVSPGLGRVATPGSAIGGSSRDGSAADGPTDYDRLEFLGDAVVGMLLADRAYQDAPGALSGELTRRRAHLARRSSLAAAAERLDLGPFVRISEGEARQGGTKRRRLLADLFEAVVGAIYLDAGLEAARAFLSEHLQPWPAGSTEEEGLPDDPKSALQERLQAEGKKAPTYQVIEVSGPPHAPLFLVEVQIEGRGRARGIGGSRREAEKQAARAALASCTEP